MAWLSKRITILYVLFFQGTANGMIKEADNHPSSHKNMGYNPFEHSDLINDAEEKTKDHDVYKYMANLKRSEISKWLNAFSKTEQLSGTISDVIDALETEIHTIGQEKLEHLHGEITKVFDDVVVYLTKSKSMTKGELNNAGWINEVDFIRNEVTNHFNENAERELKLYIGTINDNIWELVQDESIDVEELKIVLDDRKHNMLDNGIIRGTLDKAFEMISSNISDEVFNITIDALEELKNPLEEEVDSVKIMEALRKMRKVIIFRKIEQEFLLKQQKGGLRARSYKAPRKLESSEEDL